MKNVFKIVFVIIATLVGAGFASGKEIYSFFFIYGKIGIAGIFLASLIMCMVIYKTLNICYKNNINTYQGFCEYIGNKKLLNNIVNILLLITFYIMISGFSNFLKQEFNVNSYIGSIIIIILCFFTFKKNMKGIIKVSDYLVPILIFFIIVISCKNINFGNNFDYMFSSYAGSKCFGILKSVLYGCYNCILLIPILVPFKSIIKNKSDILYISIFSFILIIILIFAIYNLLLLGNCNIFKLEMPIIEIVKRYGSIYKIIYLVLVGISIFTTAISTGFGFLNNSSNQNNFKRNLYLMLFVGIFVSQISFSMLVTLLYPVLGIIGFIEIILLIV